MKNVPAGVTNTCVYAKKDLLFTAINPVGLSAKLIASQRLAFALDASPCYDSPAFNSIQFTTRCLLVFRLIFIKMSF